MSFTSKRKLKKRIQNLEGQIDIKCIVIEATLSIMQELKKELREQEDLETRINNFDNSLKKNRYNERMRNEEYKMTRWL